MQTLSPIINYDVSVLDFFMSWSGSISQPAAARGINTSTTLVDLITGVLINQSKYKISARYIITTNSGAPSTSGCPTLLSELGAIFGSTVNETINIFIIDIVEASNSGTKRSYITHFKGSSLMERCLYYYSSSSSEWLTGDIYSISLTKRDT